MYIKLVQTEKGAGFNPERSGLDPVIEQIAPILIDDVIRYQQYCYDKWFDII